MWRKPFDRQLAGNSAEPRTSHRGPVACCGRWSVSSTARWSRPPAMAAKAPATMSSTRGSRGLPTPGEEEFRINRVDGQALVNRVAHSPQNDLAPALGRVAQQVTGRVGRRARHALGDSDGRPLRRQQFGPGLGEHCRAPRLGLRIVLPIRKVGSTVDAPNCLIADRGKQASCSPLGRRERDPRRRARLVLDLEHIAHVCDQTLGRFLGGQPGSHEFTKAVAHIRRDVVRKDANTPGRHRHEP